MKSSTAASTRTRRPLAKLSDMKSNDQQGFAAYGNAIGKRRSSTPFQPPACPRPTLACCSYRTPTRASRMGKRRLHQIESFEPLPQRLDAKGDLKLRASPFHEFYKRRIGRGLYTRTQSTAMPHKLRRRMRALSSSAGIAVTLPALPGFDDVGSTDAEPCTDHGGASWRCQNPIP